MRLLNVAVLNANVFVSVAIHAEGPPGRIIERFLRTDAVTILLSPCDVCRHGRSASSGGRRIRIVSPWVSLGLLDA